MADVQELALENFLLRRELQRAQEELRRLTGQPKTADESQPSDKEK